MHLATTAFPGALAAATAAGTQGYTSTNVAAAYAAAAQQMAAMQAAVNNQQEQLNAVAALENGAATSFLPQQQDQQQILSLSLSPFAQAAQLQQQAAALQQFFHTPVSSCAAAQQVVMNCAQQQAIAAAMAQIQQQQQQQNVAAAVIAAQQQVAAAANSFLPPPPPHLHSQKNLGTRNMTNSINNNGHNQPCSTLFVANLGLNINEEEIRQLFKAYPGFSRIRMHNKGGSPVAFVEYQDVRQASVVLNILQGFIFSSSEKGNGIRIEFARTKMGDASHNVLQPKHSNNSSMGVLKQE